MSNGTFTAAWKPKEEQAGLDEEGRLVDKAVGDELAGKLKGQVALITKYESKKQTVKPPLGYSLPRLQIAASKKYDLSPSRVLEICQSLYERGITTYPRSDCEYLPDGHKEDAAKVFAVIERLSTLKVPGEIQTERKTPVFNSGKLEEHHAIIPSASCKAADPFKGDEALVFELIARRYLSFFMPDYEYLQVSIAVEIGGEAFAASGRQVQNEGWKAVEKDTTDKDEDKEDDEDNAPLPPVSEGENGECRDVRLQEKKTKAPARFTEASLLKAMNEIHRFVSNPENKKVLKETDGIGTAATQASILKELIDFGMLEKKGKQLISTPAARCLIQALPKEITLPDLTAIWELKFRQIKDGELSIDEVMEQIKGNISETIAGAKPISIEGVSGGKRDKPKQPSKGKAAKSGVKCPLCGAPMVLRKGKNGPFWGCSKYPECKATADDKDGKPVFRKK